MMRLPNLPKGPLSLLALFALSTFDAGCVAKGRYELAVVQLEATRAALSQRDADARKRFDDAQDRVDDLEAKLAETQAAARSQESHLHEVESELDRASVALAEQIVKGAVECPPLPEPIECPEVDPDASEEPEDPEDPEDPEESETPEPEPDSEEVTQRRALVKASLQDVANALRTKHRLELGRSEADSRHARVVEAFQPLIRDELVVVERIEGPAERPADVTSVVRILVAKLYNENQTTLSPLGLSIVERLTPILAELPDYELHVVGHTDDIAKSSTRLPSNWERGFAYASGLVRPLRAAGVDLPMTAASRAGTDPITEPVDAESRRLNRRVELQLTARIIELPAEGEEEDAPLPDLVPPVDPDEVPPDDIPQERPPDEPEDVE